MQSHLTRNVFRTILANEPFIAKGCIRQSRSWRAAQAAWQRRTGLQRRSLFGLSTSGLTDHRHNFSRSKGKTLMTSKIVGDLIAAQKHQFRPPPRAEVAAVLRTFFQSLSSSTPLTEYDIDFTYIALNYVRSQGEEDKRQDWDFSEVDLHNLLLALTAGAVRSSKVIKQAKELGEVVLKELLSERNSDTEALDEASIMRSDYAGTYLELLTATKHGEEALRLVTNFGGSDERGQSLWLSLLLSTAEKRQEVELTDYMEAFLNTAVKHQHNVNYLLKTIANLNMVEPTKFLYARSLQDGFTPTYGTKLALLHFAIRNRETAFGQPIFDSLDPLDTEEGAEIRRLTYLWSAARGVSAAEIALTLEKDFADSDSPTNSRPTLATINALVKYANSLKDDSAAEQYLNLIPKLGLEPNATTYLVQFEHYLGTRNIDLAVQACQELHKQPLIPENLDSLLEVLQSEEATAQQDVPLLNRLIVVVCTMDRPNYDLAMTLVETLLERTPSLESSTVAALVGVFLSRGEFQEIHDLMESHYPVFSQEERDQPRSVIVNYITDPEVDDLQAWHAYDMFRHVFADTSISIRGEIMKSFFKRKKSDLACLVFGHMRQVQEPKARPTADLYAECFKGIAACRDARGAELVHIR